MNKWSPERAEAIRQFTCKDGDYAVILVNAIQMGICNDTTKKRYEQV